MTITKKNHTYNKNSKLKKENKKIYILMIIILIIIILMLLIYFNYLINLRLDLLTINLENLSRQQIEFNEKLLEHITNISQEKKDVSIKTLTTTEKITNNFVDYTLYILEIIFT